MERGLGLRLAVGPQQGHFELGAHQGERGAEFVRGVSEELSFAVGGLSNAVEKRVERVSQASDLVVVARVDRERLGTVGPLGGQAVSLDRVQGCPSGSVSDERGGDQGGEVGDGQLEQQLA